MSTIPEPVAIIGSGCRFPGGVTKPSELWKLLKEPKDALSPIPEDRWTADGFYHENGKYHGHGNARQAYFLAGKGTHRQFDARFFGINPGEAKVLDPQIRLLLETVYEALEAAGQTIEGLQGTNTAVYVGTMLSEYERLMVRDEDTIGTYHATGTARALVSNRVSYFFDWHGPSMTLDTACSSSLIAVHQAVQQLRTKQSRVAVAAGANLILDPQAFISFSKLGMLSADGRSRMWDADANGYARGEGIAAVVLKTLSAAEADGDHIECIIREVGTNQDGRTPGLTMPSSSAQASLIRDCYARAGLDLANPHDRPQFFEAHGTGTAVGDPVEAGAIHSAFFAGHSGAADSFDRLYVGSIKSVIGHTEGTAGLAALLKGSLAVQNGTIPPNMHFNRLNTQIKPFYGNLRVPTTQLPWPSNRPTRRASVNSFGFGGANAHAVLENYQSSMESTHPGTDSTHFAPFVFSAASRQSLISYLTTFSDYLDTRRDAPLSLRDLAYTLHSRRSRLQIATTVAASSTTDLLAKLKAKLDLERTSQDQELGVRPLLQSSETRKPSIIGVFTGQGAQWARMGAELLENSATARRVIKSLDLRLSQLPLENRPSWSLLDEIQKDASSSRIGQATFSQPICTAIQILLVDIAYAAGIEFSAVVGHSSGEMGAAYAAGFISAEDAICIAYYRGLYSGLAEGSSGQNGTMMAVESTIEDIEELCGSKHFTGRVGIAAFNSPISLTVSGDDNAVKELQAILHDENKFARLLKVDKAYHSHHMVPCSEKYTAALSALNVQIRPGNKCAWFSSVHDGEIDAQAVESLRGRYWNDNLTKPVQFMQAVKAAWTRTGPFDFAIEVGPHPALKSPVLQTLQSIPAPKLPYTGLLYRGKHSTEATADGLGFVWSQVGGNYVNLQAYDAFLSGTSLPPPKLIKGLPSYAWDHESEYWHESRYARAERGRTGPAHSLLGHLTPDSTKQVMRWRNILRPTEIPWVKGHRLQGQTVFPAAGYAVLAMEAALKLCKGESVSLVEILDLELGKALTFDNDDLTAEALFSLTDIVSQKEEQTILANFTYNASEKEDDSLALLASGSLKITLGENCNATLPARSPRIPNLHNVQAGNFYKSLEKIDYEYSGPFKALSGLQRKLGYASGFISILEETDLVLHPAVLDAAFQSTFLARSLPFDGGIWALHVPRTIRSIRINPALCASESRQGNALSFDSVQPVDTTTITGDVDIYPGSLPNAMIQVQGLSCVPFAPQDAKNDKEVFATTTWDVASPDAKMIAKDFSVTPDQRSLAHLLERVSIFYLKNLERNVSANHPARISGPLSYLFKFASHCISLAHSGTWSFWDPKWNDDSEGLIAKACEPFEDVIDVKLLRRIGKHLVAIATGEKQAIEVGMQDSLLATYYQHSLGTDTYTRFLGQTVKQIVHRYPHMKMLEIGAGTGGATKSIFREIEQAYASYTFTDISSGFFATGQDVFDGRPRMVLRRW